MKAIMTGSFDPITVGHMEIIKKACQFFDEFYVVALINSEKEYTFTLEEKKEIMKLALSDIPNIKVDAYDGLTVNYMHEHGIDKIIRGIRSTSDEEYEKKLANIMKSYDSSFETIFIRSHGEMKNVSSSLVKDKLSRGEDISALIPPMAYDKIMEFYESKKNK
ncbi:MAG: pantetheine-phosphate adenylyltransferase [Clostridia bacterium]|nr:pantetheine-phosphate adenylyltransferase [Clostridia bacterium]